MAYYLKNIAILVDIAFRRKNFLKKIIRRVFKISVICHIFSQSIRTKELYKIKIEKTSCNGEKGKESSRMRDNTTLLLRCYIFSSG
jgi:hypothetical protein